MGWDKFQNNDVDIHTLVSNKSVTYLFPMLGLSLGMKKKEFLYLRGIFYANEDYPDVLDTIYMVLIFNKSRKFVLYEDYLRTLDIYSFNYDPDSYHSIFAFNVPEEYKREYKKLQEGKYSEFSENYKDSILKFHGIDKNDRNGPGKSIVGILYKKESAYRLQEEKINDGLPQRNWISIPRGQEIGTLLQEVIEYETYSQDLKEYNDKNLRPNEEAK